MFAKDITVTSWNYMVEKYLYNCSAAKRSLTLKFLKHIKDIDVPLENVAPKNIEEFLIMNQNNNVGLLRSAINQLFKHLKLSNVDINIDMNEIKNEIKKMKSIKPKKKKITMNDSAFTQAELELILSQIQDITKNRDNLIFNILFDTKLSIEEILSLKFEDFENRTLNYKNKKYILSNKTIEYFDMNCYINEKYKTILFKSFEGKPLNMIAFLTRIRKIKDNLGIKGSLVKKLNRYCERN